MSELPTGTVTFLFSDMEGSTALLQHLGGRYPIVLAGRQRLLQAAFQAADGGDGFFVAFHRGTDAAAAAVVALRAMATHPAHWARAGRDRRVCSVAT
jgi:class 3 adenylate cyclase